MKKNVIESENKIDKVVLDTAFNRFEKNYKALMGARVLISNSMFKTVEEIQNFIKQSKLPIEYNYMEFKPHFVYNNTNGKELGFNDEHLDALERGDNDFNADLLAEANAKKMVTYYIGKGYVNSEDVDKTKIPSEQLRDIKAIIDAKSQKLEF